MMMMMILILILMILMILILMILMMILTLIPEIMKHHETSPNRASQDLALQLYGDASQIVQAWYAAMADSSHFIGCG